MGLPRSFPPGTRLRSSLLDAILKELWRWRQCAVSPPLEAVDIDSDEPPAIFLALEDQVSPAATGPTALDAGTISAPAKVTDATLLVPSGTPVGALEVPSSGTITVYNTWPVTVPKNTQCWVVQSGGLYYALPGPQSDTPATDSGDGCAAGAANGSATLINGTTVTYTNWMAHAAVPTGGVKMILTCYNGTWYAVSWDCPSS